MSALRLEPLMVVLGKEFERRGMAAHLEALRAVWCLRMARPQQPGQWTEEMVLEWLALLRVPPLDRVYPVQPRNAPCPRCGTLSRPGVHHAHVKLTWPGGWKEQCASCGATWVCEDRR